MRTIFKTSNSLGKTYRRFLPRRSPINIYQSGIPLLFTCDPLHPYSPGPAPRLLPKDGPNDLIRAVAPGEHSIQVKDQRPQASAYQVKMHLLQTRALPLLSFLYPRMSQRSRCPCRPVRILFWNSQCDWISFQLSIWSFLSHLDPDESDTKAIGRLGHTNQKAVNQASS